jgi:hypothetical protein
MVWLLIIRRIKRNLLLPICEAERVARSMADILDVIQFQLEILFNELMLSLCYSFFTVLTTTCGDIDKESGRTSAINWWILFAGNGEQRKLSPHTNTLPNSSPISSYNTYMRVVQGLIYGNSLADHNSRAV